MRKKVSKTEGWLLALTAVFLCALAGLYGAERAVSPPGAPGTYTMETQRTPAEPVTPEPRWINLNTATAEELTELDGVGEVIAQRIVDYRTAHGPFTALEQLLEVKGIGEAKLADICRTATLDGTPPTMENEE